jgi:DNA-binding CsgD family transcriptional regulator
MDSPSGPPYRGERTPFVGRERERSVLATRLESARYAGGSIVLISGEPGIGKSRLLQEFARDADNDGWLVLAGRAYDTDGMPPYLPLLEALRIHVRASQPEALREQLGAGVADSALILPEVRRRLPDIPEAAPGDVETVRYRLFESVSDFLLAIARTAKAGLLLCLDDLHWADNATLLLLEHFGRRLNEAPVLIVATYRDTELDVTRPLSRTMEQFMRDGVTQRLDLRRLPREEVRTLLAALGQPEPPETLVETIDLETNGNPFFIREVFEYLQEVGRLFDGNGSWRGDFRPGGQDVPQGVRLVIGRRLERLSEACRDTLALAAVLGRSFDYQVLRILAGGDDDRLIAAVEEAERARVIVSEGGVLTFEHELIRQTILGGMNALRRQRLHLRAAEAIETAFAANLEPHLGALVEHLSLAGSANQDKLAGYSVRAGEAAAALFAYDEAILHFEVALQALSSHSPDDQEQRCHILLSLGANLVSAGRAQTVLDYIANDAFECADAVGDRRHMGSAAILALDAAERLWGPPGLRTADSVLWLERADQHVEPDTGERVAVEVRKASYFRALRDSEGFWVAGKNAYSLARRLGIRDALFLAAAYGPLTFASPPLCHFAESQRILGEMLAEPRTGVAKRTLAHFLRSTVAPACLLDGNREGFERTLADYERLAAELNDPYMRDEATCLSILKAFLEGRLIEATESLKDGSAWVPFPLFYATGLVARMNVYLGRLEAAAMNLRALPVFFAELEPPAWRTISIPSLVAIGEKEVAKRRFEDWLAAGRLGPEAYLNELTGALEAALALDEREQAQQIAALLRPMAHLPVAGWLEKVAIGRLLAETAVLEGDEGLAQAFYASALAAAQRIRFRPEVALVRLGLAGLLLKSGGDSREAARQHLDLAIRELTDMQMQPALDKALALRALAEAGPVRRPAFPDGLSAREVEVLCLIAGGRSNRQIADQLVISPNTVLRHVAHIFAKTGAANRAEAAAYAIRNGLV